MSFYLILSYYITIIEVSKDEVFVLNLTIHAGQFIHGFIVLMFFNTLLGPVEACVYELVML
jgi:hypothetical protein